MSKPSKCFTPWHYKATFFKGCGSSTSSPSFSPLSLLMDQAESSSEHAATAAVTFHLIGSIPNRTVELEGSCINLIGNPAFQPWGPLLASLNAKKYASRRGCPAGTSPPISAVSLLCAGSRGNRKHKKSTSPGSMWVSADSPGNNCLWEATRVVLERILGIQHSIEDLKIAFAHDYPTYLASLPVPLHASTEDREAYVAAVTAQHLESPDLADFRVVDVLARHFSVPILLTGMPRPGCRVTLSLGSGTPNVAAAINVEGGHAFYINNPGSFSSEDTMDVNEFYSTFELAEETARINQEQSPPMKEETIRNDVLPATEPAGPSSIGETSSGLAESAAATYDVLLATVKDFFSKHQSKASLAAKFTAPVLGVIAAIYNLVRLHSLGGAGMGDIIMNSVSMVAQFAAFISAVWEVKDATRITKILITAATGLFGGDLSHVITEKPGYVIAVKAAALLLGGAAVAAGLTKGLSSVTSAFAFASQTGDFAKDITVAVAGLMGFDVSGKKELDDLILLKTKQAQDYLAAPTAKWVGDYFQEISNFSRDTRACIQNNKGLGDTVTLGSLMTIINNIDDRIRSIREEWTNRADRVVPVGVCIWSPQGGLGKSTLARDIPLVVSKRLKGFNSNVFSYQPTAAHSSNYYGEHTVWLDEVGGARGLSPEKSPYIKLNDIISGNCVPMPSADLSGKNQVLKPKLVVLTGNIGLEACGTALHQNAAAALRTRMLELQVYHDGFDRNLDDFRNNQPTRKEDFSHLKFRVVSPNDQNRDTVYPRTDGVADDRISYQEVIDIIVGRLARAHKAFKKRSPEGRLDSIPVDYLRDGDGIVDVSHSAGDSKFLHYVAGRPGCGKSKVLAPTFIEAASLLGCPVASFNSLAEATAAAGSLRPDSLVVLDDAFNPSKQQDQSSFMTFYNSCPALTKIVVISNFGPPLGPLEKLKHSYWTRPYEYIKAFEPGLERRFPFSDTPETRLVIAGVSGAAYRNGQPFTSSSLLVDWGLFNAGTAYPKQLAKMPDPVGFTMDESDLWLELNTDDEPTIKKAVFTNSSFRLKAFLAKHDLNRVSMASLGAVLKRLFHALSVGVPDPKLYLQVKDKLYFFNGTHYYIGYAGEASSFDPNTSTLTCVTGTYPVDKDLVSAVASEVAPIDPRVADPFFYLAREKVRRSRVWFAVLAAYPPSSDTITARFAGIVKGLSDKVKALGLLNAAFGTLLALVTAVLAYVLWERFKSTEHHLPEGACEPTFPVRCQSCWDNEDGGHVYTASCPGSPVYDFSHAKGRNKARKRQSKYSGYTQIAGKRYKTYDLDGTIYESVLHDARLQLSRRSGFLKDFDSVDMDIRGNTYRASYNWTPTGVEISIDQMGDLSHGASAKKWAANSFQVSNNTASSRAYGLLVEPFLMRLPLHLFPSESDDLTFNAAGSPYSLKRIMAFQNFDVAWAVVTLPNGQVTPVPGVKSLHKALLPATQLSKFREVTVRAPSGKESHTLPFVYQSQMLIPFHSDIAKIDGKAGLCAIGATGCPLLVEGACGTIITAEAANCKEYVLGCYSGKSYTNRAYIFSVLTVEEYNAVKRSLADLSCAESAPLSIRADYLLSEEARGTKAVYTHPVIVEKLRPPSEAPNQLEGCLTTIAHAPSNLIPIDQVKGKHEIHNGHFASLFGNLKKPVLSKAAIESEFADRIPPDLKGNRHAENIRLSKAGRNVAGPSHPAYEYRRDMAEAAGLLGDYWRIQLDAHRSYAPLSVEEAIWGCSGIDSLDFSTATGAAFQMLHPGCTKKSDIFGPERGVFVGAPGAAVKTMIEQQWSSWKRGELFVLPTSYSLKTETLPNEKVWKKRIVNVCDPITVVNLRRLLMPIQRQFEKLGTQSPVLTALNPLEDYNGMAEKLETYAELYDIDFSSFDLTIPGVLLEAVSLFLRHYTGANDTLSQLFNQGFATINSGPSLCGQTLFSRDSGMPSGVPCTSFVDGLVGALVVYFSYLDAFSWTTTPEEYYHDAWSYHTGDDTVMACNEPNFTGTDVADFADRVLAMEATDPDKKGSDIPARDLSDLSYCSRTFMRVPFNTSLWTGRLKEAAISGALCYSKSYSETELRENIKMWAVEIALHGKDKYSEYVNLVRDLYKDIRLPRWESICNELAERIRSAPDSKFVTPVFDKIKLDLSTLESEIVTPISYSAVRKFSDNRDSDAVNMDYGSSQKHASKLWVHTLSLAASYEDLPLSALPAIRSQLGSSPTYSVDVQAEDGTKRSITLPAQMGSPGFWGDIVGILDQRSPGWAEQLAQFRNPFPATKRFRQPEFYRRIAVIDPQHQFQDFKMLVLTAVKDASHSEQIKEANTAQPPTTEARASSTASSGAANATPVGVEIDPLASEAIADAVLLHPTSGATKPSVVMQLQGGVGPELMPQTGIGFNLLTLAGKKIFKEIKVINTGLGQGAVIFNLPIFPWNDAILNPHTRAWADLHKRFVGALEMHIQVVSAATIIGNLKVAFIPKIYSDDLAITQSNLDAFNPLEFACNVNGEGCLDLMPTVAQNPVTGVYRDSPLRDFGRVVCIAATNIENAYTNDVGVQIKLAFSLKEGSFYDIPTTLTTTGQPPEAIDLDLGDGFEGVNLSADGLHFDGLDYSANVFAEPKDATEAALLTGTNLMPVVARAWKVTVEAPSGGERTATFGYDYAAGAGVLKDPEETDTYDLLVRTMGSKTDITNIGDGSFTVGSFASDWVADHSPDSMIYGNITIVPVDYNIASQAPNGTGPWVKVHGASSSGCSLGLGKNIIEDPQHPGRYFADSQFFTTFANGQFTWAGPNLPGLTDEWAWYPGLAAHARLTGIALCNTTSDIGDLVPSDYYNCQLTDGGSIVPSVVSGTNGHSIIPSAAHVTACVRACQYLRGGTQKSIITSLLDPSGVLVAQLLRNQHGMFIRREGNVPYTNLQGDIISYSQSHVSSDQLWPQLIVPTPGVFLNRIASTVATAGYGGNFYSSVLSPKLLQTLMVPRKVKGKGKDANITKQRALVNPTRFRRIINGDLSHAGAAAAAIGSSAVGPLVNGVFGLGNTALGGYEQRKNIDESGKQTRLDIAAKGIQDRAAIALQGQISNQLLAKQIAFKQNYMNSRMLAGNNPIGQKW